MTASALLFANNAKSSLSGAITNVATTLLLSPGTGVLFPNPGVNQYFVMTLTDLATGLLNEIVWVTARSGDVCTIVRAQEGTTALGWSAGDLAQNRVTAGSMTTLFQLFGIYITDTGAANAYVIAPAQNISAYAGGQTFNFIPANANTGASTVAVSGLAAKAIVRSDGSALQAGDIAANGLSQIIYQETLGKFVLTAVNPSALAAAAIQAQAGNYAADTGVANVYVITPTPAIGAYAGGQVFRIKPAHANTGASTVAVSGLAAKSIVHNDGSDLQAGDIPASGVIEVIYQETIGKFLLLSQSPGAQLADRPGYVKIPGTPFILQWATASVVTDNASNMPTGVWFGQMAPTLPIAFPNASLMAWAMGQVPFNGQFSFANTTGPQFNSSDLTWVVSAQNGATYGMNIFSLGW